MALRIHGQGGLLWRMLPLVRGAFALGGASWIDFYRWMLDRQERRNRMQDILRKWRPQPGRDKGFYDYARGEYHCAYLMRHGLKAHHRLFDFGCGYGRTAIPLLRYLEPGNYVGTDISTERIRMAWEYVGLAGVSDRDPTFLVTKDNRLDELAGRTFDYIWAQSVFTHMPAADARAFFANIGRLCHAGTVLLLNFNVAADGGVELENVKDFYYGEAGFRAMAAEGGFGMAAMDDWKDDLRSEDRPKASRMFKLDRLGR